MWEEATPKRSRNQVRIIAGEWRGRRLRVADVRALRPTPDRVRETLFNWLAGSLSGAHCLDLYAGTGALGLEALSRGAAHAVLVECNVTAAAALEQSCHDLKAQHAQVVRSDVLKFLSGPPSAFDVVFVDAPYDSGSPDRVCHVLDEAGWLAPGAHVYVEAARDQALRVPGRWRLLREARIGRVHGHLYQIA